MTLVTVSFNKLKHVWFSGNGDGFVSKILQDKNRSLVLRFYYLLYFSLFSLHLVRIFFFFIVGKMIISNFIFLFKSR